jgi:hypothetical protein
LRAADEWAQAAELNDEGGRKLEHSSGSELMSEQRPAAVARRLITQIPNNEIERITNSSNSVIPFRLLVSLEEQPGSSKCSLQ